MHILPPLWEQSRAALQVFRIREEASDQHGTEPQVLRVREGGKKFLHKWQAAEFQCSSIVIH
jgi:hypothetical protein